VAVLGVTEGNGFDSFCVSQEYDLMRQRCHGQAVNSAHSDL